MPSAILVVEDEPDIRDCVAEALRMEGFSVSTARDGVDALAVVKAAGGAFAAIVVDIMMPRMSGADFVREARKAGSLAHVPVVTITASDGRIQGAAAHLRKPFAIAELIGVVRRCIGAAP